MLVILSFPPLNQKILISYIILSKVADIRMVSMTAARDVFNLGVENAMLSRGSDLAKISREVRANSCQACRDWAGKIFSISGKNPNYPSLQDAKDANVFHSHCIHFLEDLNEDRYAGTGHYIGGAV
jgi:hypothetical protein